MKLGLRFANTGPFVEPDAAAALGEALEATGFESIWAAEHVVVPRGRVDGYPYAADGRLPPFFADLPIADPLLWLTWVAAQTRDLVLGTSVLVLPQRPAAVVAKEVATLDRLSRGRAVLGVGIGWMREEFDALGASFPDRGRRTDEAIETLRSLWRDPAPTLIGHEEAGPVACLPRPFRPDGVPILIGGHSEAAARRAGRLGDGFLPARGSPAEVAGLVRIMRAAAVEAGREAVGIEVTCGSEPDPDAVRRYAEVGVDRVLLPLPGRTVDTVLAGLERYADEIGARL